MLNIFRLVILSLLLLVLNVGQTAENNLTLFKNPVCSSSGTVVLFLNGIENKKVDAINSTDEIKKIVGINPYPKNGVPALFDENSIDVQYIYNRTVDKQNDVNEIAIQKIKEHAGFKSEKWAVLKTALMDETITPQLLEEYEVLKKQLPLSFLYFDSLIALKKDHDSNLLMKEILERYEEDLKDLSGKVQGYLKNKKKVVIVSHSQGNLFANDIYQKLVQEATTTEEQDLINTYLANLQVAGFGEQTYIPKSAIIKLDLDKAVNKMGYPSNMRMVFGNSGINHNFISTRLRPISTI